MNRAVILNNIPCCPKCNVQLANMTGDYKEVIHEGEKYVQFERYCNSCRGKFIYQANIELDKHDRFSFDKVEIIKESKGEIKDVDTER